MARTHGSRCYLCGDAADGADEHVPPEVFFRGKEAAYMSPRIITVPSCAKHNEDTSGDDESCARIVADAASSHSQIAFDVGQRLSAPVVERAMADLPFVDERLALVGMRLLRGPSSYADDGLPRPKIYDQEYIKATEARLRTNWNILKRTFQKVAAGLFYDARRTPLGVARTAKLNVFVPGFKQVEPVILLVAPTVDEAQFFDLRPSGRNQWIGIESGSPKVFQSQLISHKGSSRLRLRLQFFETTHVWIKSYEEPPN